MRSSTPLVLPLPRPTANGKSEASRPCKKPNRGLELLAETPPAPRSAACPGKSVLCDETEPSAEILRGHGDDESELDGDDAFATFEGWFRMGIDIGAESIGCGE